MWAFGFHIAGLVVRLTQQVVFTVSDFSQVTIDISVLLSERLFPNGNS